jgi:hypothetical protein
MASLLSLGHAACERRFQGMACPCSACQFGGLSQQSSVRQLALSAAASAPTLGNYGEFSQTRTMTPKTPMTPGLATTAGRDWLLPMPPVRFPLRDALISLQESQPATERSRSSIGSSMPKSPRSGKKSLASMSTAKTRMQAEVGRLKREGKWHKAEVAPVVTPRAPPDEKKAPPKAVPSLASRTRQGMLRAGEAAGHGSFRPVVEKSEKADDQPAQDKIRATWTSAARAVLSHTRRSIDEGQDLEGGASEIYEGLEHIAPGVSLQPLKEWIGRGLEFCDGGLGIGMRDSDKEILNMVRRSPGPTAYITEKSGSVSLFDPYAPLPTKQPNARHTSTETHRIGVRRDHQVKLESFLGPGTYTLKGFTDEIIEKYPRQKRGQQRPNSRGH